MINAKRITLAAIFSLATAWIWAGDPPEILHIRKIYNETESNISHYREIARGPLWESTEGGSVTCYLNKEEFRKIEIGVYGEIGRYLSYYYFEQNRLIFVYEESYKYRQHIMEEDFDENEIEMTTARTYFQDGKMIRRLDTEKKEETFSPEKAVTEFSRYNEDAESAKERCLKPEEEGEFHN